jgi:hypothetical protein
MHVNQVVRAGRLVQPVDILGYGEHLAAISLFEVGEREMRRIGLRLFQPEAAHVVEVVHHDGIAGEAFRRRHVFETEMVPQPIVSAKRAEPAFGRESCSRQDDDFVELHSSHPRRRFARRSAVFRHKPVALGAPGQARS